MPILGEGLEPNTNTNTTGLNRAGPSATNTNKMVYVLHPNCAVEEM